MEAGEREQDAGRPTLIVLVRVGSCALHDRVLAGDGPSFLAIPLKLEDVTLPSLVVQEHAAITQVEDRTRSGAPGSRDP